ncbi:ABC transporter ATP-binding protein [Tepidanaerobacter sp. EBM-49]|uniref:ABC transporter ATP-binding protein n=1 Tax=Tepidanaerobacter sp. EBM-49 TaxID=1918504 RepID=UPI00257E1EA9|nr:ABC transporter ATP-binding protein [Tepidanaerobacter sp. EBM-49]
MSAQKNLLEVKNLTTNFYTKKGILTAVDKVSLSVDTGEVLGIVGESGSGKTITSLSVMQLLPVSSKVAEGEIIFQGENLLKKSEEEMQKIRGKLISMIFQDPMAALDPVYTCGAQMIEAILAHQKVSKEEAEKKSVDMLKNVGIPAPENCMKSYPHELSGGMCQRVMIGMALLCNPKLLIADEPTTALDVTVQAQILELLKSIKNDRNMSIIIITHDLGVVSEIAQKVAVMYNGRIFEEADTDTLFLNPMHPYTQGLIKSMPKPNQPRERLFTIKGTVPSLSEIPQGCRFNPRCSKATDICRTEEPELVNAADNHKVRCWHI